MGSAPGPVCPFLRPWSDGGGRVHVPCRPRRHGRTPWAPPLGLGGMPQPRPCAPAPPRRRHAGARAARPRPRPGLASRPAITACAPRLGRRILVAYACPPTAAVVGCICPPPPWACLARPPGSAAAAQGALPRPRGPGSARPPWPAPGAPAAPRGESWPPRVAVARSHHAGRLQSSDLGPPAPGIGSPHLPLAAAAIRAVHASGTCEARPRSP